jgi:hypothetical protein
MDPRDGAAERAGRTLARAVVRGRAAARRLSEPAVRERLLAAGRSVAAERGPDAAEQAAERVVDRALWGIALRAGFLGAALHQLRPAASRAAGKLARGVAERVRSVEDGQEPGSQRPADHQR